MEQIVTPLFVLDEISPPQEIGSMPGIFRYSLDDLLREVEVQASLGVQAIALFPVIPTEKKDASGSEALNEQNILFRAIRAIKRAFPSIAVIADPALDPFTDHGHDGLMDDGGNIQNDATCEVLGKVAVLAAEAGAALIAPSDMMDGRVAKIRRELDQFRFSEVGIISYAAKYASAFYGPFREALGSAPKFGDKKGYQMNPANVREALLECRLDEEEGADMLLIKPALAYLDVISKVRQQSLLPVGAYHVSGEYAMVMAAAQKGWVDADRVFFESLLSIKRAGADFIFTYAAKKIAPYIQS